MVTSSDWEKGISYLAYREMVNDLVAAGKTTGEEQSEKLLNYTQMNVQRMRRWDKTAVINPDLHSLLQKVVPQKWLVLTEGWCGDVSQSLPTLVKMADASPHIELRVLLRDENNALMNMYLTNGGKSIPKLIAVDTDFNELFNWGPRPVAAQTLITTLKQVETPFEELSEQLHKWYATDKNAHLQAEFIELLQSFL